MGHGWVTPNADGSKARCGGPGLCPECAREVVKLHADSPNKFPNLVWMAISSLQEGSAWAKDNITFLTDVTEGMRSRADNAIKAVYGKIEEIEESHEALRAKVRGVEEVECLALTKMFYALEKDFSEMKTALADLQRRVEPPRFVDKDDLAVPLPNKSLKDCTAHDLAILLRKYEQPIQDKAADMLELLSVCVREDARRAHEAERDLASTRRMNADILLANNAAHADLDSANGRIAKLESESVSLMRQNSDLQAANVRLEERARKAEADCRNQRGTSVSGITQSIFDVGGGP